MIVGGGTEIALEDAMVEYIRLWTADDLLRINYPRNDSSEPFYEPTEVKEGPPTVHAGMLPKQETGIVDIDAIPVFPFVLCHIFKGRDAIPEGNIYTRIVVGVWDNNTDYQGYRDALRLMRKIVRAIWWENTLASSYQMENLTDWRVYDTNEVSWPYFMSEAIVGWRERTPITKSESDDELQTPSKDWDGQSIIPSVDGRQPFDVNF